MEHMYINTIAYEVETATRVIQSLSEGGFVGQTQVTNKLTKTETIAFLQTEAAALAAGKPTTHLTEREINTLLKVANKMSPDEFYCQDPFKMVVNICTEPLAQQKGTAFYNEMFDKCLSENGVYLVYKYSNSRICKDEAAQYEELDSADYITAKEGDIRTIIGSTSDSTNTADQ